ncbi:TetR/AcrR family transcriptional regulator [Nocardia sp. GCM10030253]|uniref:TetR/AcrR family transcriptional regulator n=1 Tax=Nocardia sp. GCM10030253 TaxID=3273404 RepID=UPI0036400D1A
MSTEAAVVRSAKRRSELVQSAYELFVSKGYRNVSVADIVARVGVSHGTFYNYFDNKRDVLDAVIDHYFVLIQERILGLDNAENPRTLDEFCAVFSRMIDRCYELVESEPGLVNFILLEAASIDSDVIDRTVGNLRIYGDAAKERIGNGISQGFLDPEVDPRIAGEVLLSVILSALLSAMRGGSDGLTRQRVNTELTAFVRAALAATIT